jgi:hypothetical protein
MILTRPWRRQPPSPVAVSKKFGEIGFLWAPQVSVFNDYLAGGISNAAWAAANGGPVARSICSYGIFGRGGSNRGVRFSAETLPSSTSYTILAAVVDDSGRGIIRNPFDGDNEESLRWWQLRFDAGDTARFIAFNTTSSAFQATTSIQSSSTGMAVLVGRVANSEVSVWMNGRKGSGTAAPSGTMRSASSPGAVLAVGAMAKMSAYQQGFAGQILLCAYFARALTDAEIVELSGNPWQLFAPRRVYASSVESTILPTLSAPTYVPGSLTSSGWIPQVTAT